MTVFNQPGFISITFISQLSNVTHGPLVSNVYPCDNEIDTRSGWVQKNPSFTDIIILYCYFLCNMLCLIGTKQ